MADGLLIAVTKAIIWRLYTAGVGDDTTAVGQHDPSLPRLTVKVMPPGSEAGPSQPDRIIAVTAYSRTASPNPKILDRAVSVQLMIRGGMNALLDPEGIASQAFSALHGQHHVTWNGLVIDRCAHSYGSPMGPDDQQRWEWSENYTVVLQQRSTP